MLRESVQSQLRQQRDRGTDRTLFSPRAGGMSHHSGSEQISRVWSRLCNDLIHRVVQLYPDNFVGVCQLPQFPVPFWTIRPSSSTAIWSATAIASTWSWVT